MYTKSTLLHLLSSITLLTSTLAAPTPSAIPPTTDISTLSARHFAQLSPESPAEDLQKRFTQSQTGNLSPGPFPLPKGTNDIPADDGSQLCLCNNENYGDCMCIKDINIDGFNTCLSNRGSDGPWKGFKNDAVSSVLLTGMTPAACKLYETSDCMGQPFLVLSSAEERDIRPQMPSNDKLSSIFCGQPQAIFATLNP